MAIIKGTNGLSLNEQHDFITLRTPNGNFTTSWNGAKASGKLAQNSKAFNALDKYVQTSSNFGEAMRSLLDPKVLTSLWSDWNEEVKQNLFLPEDKVVFVPGLFTKKYPKGGIVTQVAKKNVYIRLADTNQVIGFDYQYLIKQ
jgi:hypothetical protein